MYLFQVIECIKCSYRCFTKHPAICYNMLHIMQLGEHTVRTLRNNGVNVILNSILAEGGDDIFIDQIKVFGNHSTQQLLTVTACDVTGGSCQNNYSLAPAISCKHCDKVLVLSKCAHASFDTQCSIHLTIVFRLSRTDYLGKTLCGSFLHGLYPDGGRTQMTLTALLMK